MLAPEEGCSCVQGDQTDPALINGAGLIRPMRLHAKTELASHCAAFKSFWQSAIIVEHVLMFEGAERLLEVCGAVAPNQ